MQTQNAETNENKHTSWLAVVSLVSSLFLITAPIAIVLGFVAKSEIKNNKKTLCGDGLATWGIGLGFAGVLYVFACVASYNNDVKNWERQEKLTKSVARSIISNGGSYRDLQEGGFTLPHPKPEFSLVPFLNSK